MPQLLYGLMPEFPIHVFLQSLKKGLTKANEDCQDNEVHESSQISCEH